MFSGGTAPWGITRDPNTGILYVTGSNNNNLYAIATNGMITTVGTGLNNPRGVGLDPTTNRIGIANSGTDNIFAWTIGGAAAPASIGALNPAPTAPRGVTFDSSGNMYVADTGNDRILFFPAGQTTGRVIGPTGGLGNGNNQLDNPSAVKLDSQGNLYNEAFNDNSFNSVPNIINLWNAAIAIRVLSS
ncbi:unnamed protein product [Rotaria sp. Silwood1]|nr:unnamed protein product [Rotaria sp. Silwood1]